MSEMISTPLEAEPVEVAEKVEVEVAKAVEVIRVKWHFAKATGTPTDSTFR